MNRYADTIARLVQDIQATQQETMNRLAARIADSIRGGGVLHLFGSGHSHMIAEDAFHRAGGLACVNAMLEPSLMELNAGRATSLERLEGYAEVLLSGYDARAGEVVIIISNSGINAVPVEMAQLCKARGLHVAAITSLRHSRAERSRHSSGTKLYEIADTVIDNCGVHGDAALQVGTDGPRTGPTSTLAGVFIIQSLTAAIVEQLHDSGFEPPVFVSANRQDGGSRNAGLYAKYASRVRYLQEPAPGARAT